MTKKKFVKLFKKQLPNVEVAYEELQNILGKK